MHLHDEAGANALSVTDVCQRLSGDELSLNDRPQHYWSIRTTHDELMIRRSDCRTAARNPDPNCRIFSGSRRCRRPLTGERSVASRSRSGCRSVRNNKMINRAHSAKQFSRAEGLRKGTNSPEFNRGIQKTGGGRTATKTQSGNRQDRQAWQVPVKMPNRLQSIHRRHEDIDDPQVELHRHRHRNGLAAVFCLRHVVPGISQYAAHSGSHVIVVVDKENIHCTTSSLRTSLSLDLPCAVSRTWRKTPLSQSLRELRREQYTCARLVTTTLRNADRPGRLQRRS